MYSKSLFVGLVFGAVAGIGWLWNLSSRRLTSKKIKEDFKVAACAIESLIARLASAKTSLVHENETLSLSTDNLNWTGTWGYALQEYNGYSLSVQVPAITVLEFIRAEEDTYCHFVPIIAIDRLISMNPGHARRAELVKGNLYSSIKIMNEPPTRIMGNLIKDLNYVEGILQMSSKETVELTAISVPKLNKKHDDTMGKEYLIKPLVRSHFVDDKNYVQLWPILLKLLNDTKRSENEFLGAFNSGLFKDAMSNICWINRTAVHNSGKLQSLTKSASISSINPNQIQLKTSYGIVDLKVDQSNLYIKAESQNIGKMFMMTESQVTDDNFLSFINKNFDKHSFEMCPEETEFKLILFGLCYFYASIHKKYKNLTISMKVLYNYLREVMHEGHVTDDWDKKLFWKNRKKGEKVEKKMKEDLLLPTGTLAQPTTDFTINQNQRSYSERSENVVIQTPLEMHSNDLVSTSGRNELTTIDTVRPHRLIKNTKNKKEPLPPVELLTQRIPHAVELLNQRIPRIHYNHVILSNNPAIIKVKARIRKKLFVAQASTKKKAKIEVCIAALHHFYSSEFSSA